MPQGAVRGGPVPRNSRREDAAVARSGRASLRLGAYSSNKHEARVNIDVESFFIARNGRLFLRF